jgi:hypothetical protein
VRKVFVIIAGLLLAVVVIQFFLAAMGAFERPRTEDSFAPHRMLGWAVPILALLTTGAAALARAPGRLIGLAALPIALGVMQALIRVFADMLGVAGDTTSLAGAVVFGVHGVNGLIIMGACRHVVVKAGEFAAAPRPARAGRAPSTTS